MPGTSAAEWRRVMQVNLEKRVSRGEACRSGNDRHGGQSQDVGLAGPSIIVQFGALFEENLDEHGTCKGWVASEHGLDTRRDAFSVEPAVSGLAS